MTLHSGALRGIFAVTLGLGTLVLAGCSQKEAPKAPSRLQRAYLVRTAAVATQEIKYEIETTGSIEAKDVYRIDAQVPGTIYETNFSEGDLVTPQTVLCKIAPVGYKLYALKAEGAYKKALADLTDTERRTANDIATAEVKLHEAEIEVTRRRSVRAVGAISDEEVQLYQARRDLAEIELKDMKDASKTLVEAMRTAILEKEAAWKIAEDDVRKSTVLAPVEGRIESRSVVNGNYVLAGTPIALLVDMRTLKLKFTLPDDQAAHVVPGGPVIFRVGAYPQRDFKATIYYVGNTADPVTRLVNCWAKVEPNDANLKAGFFATAKIVTEERKRGVVVPLTSILPTEHGFVAFIIKDGKAVRRQVETGLHVADRSVEILSGVAEGEVIVIDGANSLQDGVTDKIMENAKSSDAPAAESKSAAPATEAKTAEGGKTP